MVALKANSLTITVALKIRSLATTVGGKIGLELPKSPIPRELSLFYLSGSSMEKLHSQDLSLFNLTQRSFCVNTSNLGMC